MPARRLIAAAVIAAGLSLGWLAAQPATAAEIVEGSQEHLTLEVDKGRLVRLQRPAATVFVANPEIADIQVRSPRLIYVLARTLGETTLYAVDGQERILANMDVTVQANIAGFRRAARAALPQSDVHLASANDAVILEGTVGSPRDAEAISRIAARYAPEEGFINRVKVDAPTQVNLRVRVAEINRDIDKQLGFNWGITGNIGGVDISIGTNNPFNNNVSQHTLGATTVQAGWDLNTVVDALEQEGLVTILAEPNLTALSGESANFLAGGEFPILIPEGDSRVVIEFREFGVRLDFTPTILDGNRINLHVRPEVSQLSTTNAVVLNNFQIPSLTTRRAETTVELASGQTFAIAGLLQNNITHSISKFPGLGDLPILGALFRSDRFQREETELVILVTPYLVKPIDTKLAATPLDGFSPPHDIERLFAGGGYRRNRTVGEPRTVGKAGLIGPAGFVTNQEDAR